MSFWHGNPNIFAPELVNYRNKKTFGQLYKETMEREVVLRNNRF